MHDTQFRLLTEILQNIAASLAQLVTIQQMRLVSDQTHMTIDDALLQQILDAGNTALAAEATDVAASKAKDATILNLQAQLAANPALAAAAATFLNNALAANPPGTPATPPDTTTTPATVPVTDPSAPAAPAAYDSTKSYNKGDTVTFTDGAVYTATNPTLIGDGPGTSSNWSLTTPVPAAPAAL